MTLRSDRYTEEEKILLLEKAGMPVSDNASSVEVNEKFHALQEKVLEDKHIDGHLDSHEIMELVEDAHMASIIVKTLTPGSNAIPHSLSSIDIKALQSALNQVPWETIASVGMAAGKFLVAGSMAASPQTLAIMVGVTLIMRLRLGTIFSGGGNSIQLLLQNLAAKDPEDLATASMNIIKNIVKNPKDVVIQLEGSGSKLFKAFAKEMGSLAEKMGFDLHIPHFTEKKETAYTSTTPQPFNMELKPKGTIPAD